MPNTSALATFLADSSAAGATPDPGFVAYLASLERIHEVAPQVAGAIVSELADQRSNLKMIASENYSSLAVQLAQGNLLDVPGQLPRAGSMKDLLGLFGPEGSNHDAII